MFEENVVFARATFNRSEANFIEAIFKQKANFEEARFEAVTTFGGAEFGEAIFKSADFHSRVSFGNSRFGSLADFGTAAFRVQADFNNASFEAGNFTFTRFCGGASFFRATFHGTASFDWAEFSELAEFGHAAFDGRASFERAKFGSARFGAARFQLGATFDGATFSGEAEFQLSTFGSDSTGNKVVADFSDVQFEKPTRVWFTQVNKGSKGGLRARFLNCDVEHVNLEDVRWHRRRSGRMVLQDELDILEGGREKERTVDAGAGHSEYELVAIAYRKLINNFDNVRALDLAEDCFCGAMEMKRRDPKESLSSRAVLSVYKLASSYGSNYVQALLVLLGIVLVTGFVFAIPWLELGPARGNPGAVQMASSWLRRCPAGLFHSLQVATFQRDAVYAFTLRRGRLIVIAEQVLVPIQAALLLLAVRRRFRR